MASGVFTPESPAYIGNGVTGEGLGVTGATPRAMAVNQLRSAAPELVAEGGGTGLRAALLPNGLRAAALPVGVGYGAGWLGAQGAGALGVGESGQAGIQAAGLGGGIGVAAAPAVNSGLAAIGAGAAPVAAVAIPAAIGAGIIGYGVHETGRLNKKAKASKASASLEDEARKYLDGLDSLGVSDDVKRQVAAYYHLYVPGVGMGADDPKEDKAARAEGLAGFIEAVKPIIAQGIAAGTNGSYDPFSPEYIAATQARAGEFMAPFIEKARNSSAVASQAFLDAANSPGLSEGMRHVLQAQAAAAASEGDSLAKAYQAQAQATPLYMAQQQAIQAAAQAPRG